MLSQYYQREVPPSLNTMEIARHSEARQKYFTFNSLLNTMLGAPIPVLLLVLDLKVRFFKYLDHSSQGSLSKEGFS